MFDRSQFGLVGLKEHKINQESLKMFSPANPN